MYHVLSSPRNLDKENNLFIDSALYSLYSPLLRSRYVEVTFLFIMRVINLNHENSPLKSFLALMIRLRSLNEVA